ncbi:MULTISPECIES: ribosome hibernation-promoting factor, HPF/YfiA family [unclassified Phycicoccus]|uniref:ribosome hibernation-promoting factor, HPF/YfiA family n=1 Tax=unclassified Phycicoccus TaxID=2637926 RepID=UPI000703C034|nr:MULTISPECIES: ribosome-associated translation inhibitor RaiA [unclassified Phycicoccus]KRF24191.1 30S ribosomal protein S30 [Phycicoccus sp. Soil803]KRF27149.1 30S ribosomal protein S30 [Phycicoccus sp. Soil802]
MEIVVTGRHMQVSDRFRDHLDEKLAKIPQLAPRVQRVDVIVSHEPNKRQAKSCERVEITCHVKGPIVRAEACLDDKYAALDLALDKLMERLRRAQDRKRVHRGRHAPESVAAATARIQEPGASTGEDHVHDGLDGDGDRFGAQGNSPVEIREKIHATVPMALDQAVREMELVGHDFYLYHDEDTGQPSVVYRRRGWSYGVIHLDVTEDEGAERKVS